MILTLLYMVCDLNSKEDEKKYNLNRHILLTRYLDYLNKETVK